MRGAFYLGEWFVHPDDGTVTRAGEEHQLDPKVTEVLLYLTDHPGEVLPRERLIQAVWWDAAVTDDVLTHAISELRKAIEDDPKHPRYIETLPRRGYRLMVPARFPGEHFGENSVAENQREVLLGPGPDRLDRRAGEERNRKANRPVQDCPARIIDFGLANRTMLARDADQRDESLHELLPKPDEGRENPGPQLAGTSGPAGGTQSRSRSSQFWALILLLLACGVAVVFLVFWLPFAQKQHFSVRVPGVVPLTSLPGHEEYPSLSPDGTQIAFIWRRKSASDAGHVCVQLVNAGEPLILTPEEGVYSYPAWSPDGTQVIFSKRTLDGHEVVAIPVLGGPERLLVRSKAPPFGIDYSPDGSTIAYVDRPSQADQPSIYLLSPESLEKERLSNPKPIGGSKTLDALPRFSPTGDRLAFQRVLAGTGGVGPIMISRLRDGKCYVALQTLFASDFDWGRTGKTFVVSTGAPEGFLAEMPIGRYEDAEGEKRGYPSDNAGATQTESPALRKWGSSSFNRGRPTRLFPAPVRHKHLANPGTNCFRRCWRRSHH